MEDNNSPSTRSTENYIIPSNENKGSLWNTIWNSIKPTADKILVFLILLLFKQTVFFLIFIPLISGSTLGSIFILIASLILSPQFLISAFVGGYSRNILFQILYSYSGLIYLYFFSLILHRLIKKQINLTASTFIRKVRVILWVLFFIVLIFPTLIFLPTINKDNVFTDNIDYEKLSKPSYHTISSLNIPNQKLIEQFPEVQLVELWRESKSSSLIPIDRFFDKLFSPVGATSFIMPAYKYKVEGNRIILSPDIACIDLEKSKLIVADGWSNSILPVENLPLKFENEFISATIKMRLQSLLPDGSIEITKDGKSISISPNQEYVEQVRKTGVISGRETSWGIRNFGPVKVQCYPDFVYNTKEKNRRLFELAQREGQETYCAQITLSEDKDRCYKSIYDEIIKEAKELENVELCKNINPQTTRVDMHSKCLKEVASITKRNDLCLAIPNSAMADKQECFKITSNEEICNDIADPIEKDNCFYGIHYCEFINDKKRSDSCYLNYLSEIWERLGYEGAQTVCEDISITFGANTAEFNRGVCYQELAQGVAGKDPNNALALIEKVEGDIERQNIMYRLIADVVAETDMDFAIEICGKISVDTLHTSQSQCLQYVNSKNISL